MAQFSKDTFIYFRSENKNPIYFMCKGVQSSGQYFVMIL